MEEMNNAIQYQIYEQLRNLNESVQGISFKQDRSAYRDFSQSMPVMQMQYAQAQMPSYTGGFSPYSGGMMGGAQAFLDNQMQGIYSGFGITPEMRNFAQATMLQPAGTFINQQYLHSKSLVGNLAASAFTNPTLGMTDVQKQIYSTNLAANTALSGLSVAQGAGTIGAGALSVLGMGKVMGAVGLGPLALAAGAVWGGTKIASSEALNKLTHGRIGGMDPRIFSPISGWTDYFKERVENERDLKNMLAQDAYKIINIDGLDGYSGVDLSIKSKGDWTAMMSRLDERVLMRDSELQNIIKGSVDRGLLTNMGDVEEGADYLEKLTDFIRKAEIILGGTHEDIMDLMVHFKKAGLGTANFDVMAAELKGFAALMNKDINEVADFALSVTQQRVSGTTLNAKDVYDSAHRGAALISDFFTTYKDTGAYGEAVSYITNKGENPLVVEDIMFNTLDNLFSMSQGYLPVTMAAIMSRDKEGNFSVDHNKLDQLIYAVSSEGLDMRDVNEIAFRNIESWDTDTRMLWDTSSEHIFRGVDFEDKLLALGLSIDAVRKVHLDNSGEPLKFTTSAATFMGMDLPQAQLLEGLLDHYKNLKTEGRDIQSIIEEIATKIEQDAQAELDHKKKLEENFIKSTNMLDNIFDHTAKPIIEALERLLDPRGKRKLNIDDMDPRKKEEIEEARLRRTEAAAGKELSNEDRAVIFNQFLERDSRDKTKSTTIRQAEYSESNLNKIGVLGVGEPVNVSSKNNLTKTVDTLLETISKHSGSDELQGVLDETNKTADKANRVTEQHASILQTYMRSLETNIASLEEQLARSSRYSSVSVFDPIIFSPGRFAYNASALG